jgi:extracellular elastinolytic metalloproteinase
MLHNVYAALVTKLGFSKTAQTDVRTLSLAAPLPFPLGNIAEHLKSQPTGAEGNVVFMHLFIDSLALQPCNPDMPAARDAWIQADANRFDGANRFVLRGVHEYNNCLSRRILG